MGSKPPGKPRDYGEIIDRISKLDRRKVRVSVIGKVSGKPLYCIAILSNENSKNVLLSAGIHGDEPAGPEAILRMLENASYEEWFNGINFYILPCINPTGYGAGTRENLQKVDINRSFANNRAKEAVIIKDFVRGKRFDLFLEFHEDWEYEGFYLYELYRGRKERFGAKIIRELRRKRFKIHSGIADGRTTRGGIVQVGRAPGWPSGVPPVMPLYLSKYNTDHIITCETPSRLDLESRIQMHLSSFKVAMSELSKS